MTGRIALAIAALVGLLAVLPAVTGLRLPTLLHDAPLLPLSLWAVAAVAVAGSGRAPLQRLDAVLLRLPPVAFGTVASVAVGGLCAALSWSVFDAIPHVQDEIVYDFQAKLLAAGRLWWPSHPLSEFFTLRFTVNDGRFYGLFQPGWPALLAGGHLLGAAHLTGPACGAAATGLFYGCGRRLLGESAGRWATLLFAASSVVLFQFASMMSHPLAATLGLAALYGAVRYARAGRALFAFLVGASLGGLFVVRAATAVALATPYAVAIAWLLARRRVSARHLAWLGLGIAATAWIQPAYNLAVTGDAATFPQDRYFAATEPVPDCHRLGLGDGIGCPREHGPDLGADGFTAWRALQVTRMRLAQFRVDLFGTGFGLAFLVLGLVDRRLGAWRYLLLGLPAALVGLYLLYYYHGNCLGARYYFEAVPACVLLIAAGLRSLIADAERPWAYGMAVATAAFLPVYSLVVTVPDLASRYSRSFWGVDRSVEQAIQRHDVHDAVVLIPGDDKDYRIGFWLNEPGFDTDVIVARDHGRQNTQLAAWYPERAFFRFEPDGAGLVPLTLDRRRDRVWLEGEAKFPPIRREGGYAAPAQLGDSGYLRFDATGAGAFVELRQYLFEAGRYVVEARFTQGPDHGIVRLSIDGEAVLPSVDGYRTGPGVRAWRVDRPLPLSRGLHTVRLELVGAAPAASGFVAGLDAMRFEQLPAED